MASSESVPLASRASLPFRRSTSSRSHAASAALAVPSAQAPPVPSGSRGRGASEAVAHHVESRRGRIADGGDGVGERRGRWRRGRDLRPRVEEESGQDEDRDRERVHGLASGTTGTPSNVPLCGAAQRIVSSMIEITGTYEGDLRCRARHGPSDAEILTDAPVDNQASAGVLATDLVAASLGTCVLTILGIAAKKRGVALAGARFVVTKEMVADPRRRIGSSRRPSSCRPRSPKRTGGTGGRARTCPLTETLRGRVEMTFSFVYE